MILLQEFNISPAVLFGLLGSVFSALLLALGFIFTNNRQENKDRIDTRAKENAENTAKINMVENRITSLENRATYHDRDVNELKAMIREYHADLNKRFDILFSKLADTKLAEK